ncbi:MAG: dockerin [Clostridium sp.]|nr:dockerin [Clostridium sp.]
MRKSVSVVLVVIMLLTMLTPFSWFSANAKTDQTLFINEVMSSNESTIRDGDIDDPKHGSKGGAYSDWIEIYNAGTKDVDLTGYTIADSSAEWTFPQGIVPAGGYLLIWASDKDKVAADGQLHTNFKLSASGEPLIFKAPDGTVIDSVDIISLADDQSYGRETDGSSKFVVFSKATPGSANIPEILPEQTLFINEVMASNVSTIRDGDVDDPEFGSKGGAYSDWIEIYNAGDKDVNLAGYTIADTSAEWVFPDVTVPARGYLLLWASDKNKVAADGQLHTNFKLSKSGEVLTLKNPDGTVIDIMILINLSDDEAYGRKTDGSSEMSLLKPTPGSVNIFESSLIPVSEPVFSHAGGFYTNEFDLQISAQESNVKIYYTTDCSDPVPGEAGTYEYNRNIRIKSRKGDPNVLSMIQDISNDIWNRWKAPKGEVFKCTTIKAVAVREDGAQSKVVTHSYFVDPDIYNRYTLPVVSLVTEYENLFDKTTGLYVNQNYENSGAEWERPVHVEVFDTDGSTWFSQSAGMRIHGGYTRKYPQKSFRLYADHGDGDTDKFKYEIFPGLRGTGTGKKIKNFERLILRNAGNDWTGALFRDEMMQSLVSHLKLDTQSFRPCIVFLNGEYWGIYHFRERFDDKYLKDHYDLDGDRVAILDVFEKPSVQEGDPEDVLAYTEDVINYLKSHSITDKSTYDYIKTKIDIDNYIDYNVAEIFFGNTDWPGNNVSIWRYKTESGEYEPDAPYGQDGRWRWFLKDTDFGFGLYEKPVSHNTLAFAAGDTQEGYANEPWAVFLFKTLLQNDEFRNEFINRFADQLNTSFVPSRVNEIIDGVVSTLEPEMQEHTDRWPFIKLTRTSFMDKTWSEEVQTIKNYANNRPTYVRQHIINKFRSNGVTGTSYVTLNTDTDMGHIKINSIDIQSGTPAVTNPDSWTGIYFRGVPVTVKAIPKDGYVFDHWEGISGADQSSDTVTFTLSKDVNITAVFKPLLAPPTLYGDVNADGFVDSLDLTILKRYILRSLPQNYYVDKKAADVDADGSIDSLDVSLLKRFLLRKIDKLPAQN